MISIYLCDDSKPQLDRLETVIQNYLLINPLNAKITYKTQDPQSLLLDLKENPPRMGLYFLDVDLNAPLSGFDLALKIREADPRAYIVFITVHDQMAGEPYRMHIEAMDFIGKNQKEKDARIVQCLEDAAKNYQTLPDENFWKKNLIVRTNGEPLYLEADKIYYIETADSSHKLNIYMTDQFLQIRDVLKEISPQLDSNQFCHCHRSYLINVDYVLELLPGENELLMANGARIPVSTRSLLELKRLLKRRAQAKAAACKEEAQASQE